jgi:cell wall-associated NlpC family hydrolase
MTARYRIAYLARHGLALTLVVALLGALPAFAAPATSTPSPDSALPAPVVIGPGSVTGPVDGNRPAPEASAIGNVGVDEQFNKELAAKQAQIDAFTAQLDELDRELSIASEAYNEASDRLNEMKEKVHTAELDLANTNKAFDQVSGVLDEQLGTMYRSGSYSAIEILLDAKSLTDFVQRLKFLNTVGTDSAQVLEDYAKVQADLQDQVFKLRNAKRAAESLEFELKARKIEVELRIAERQKLFGSARADLLTLLSKQAELRQTQEAALLKEILGGASKAGITVQPGSPVETILAYHGVPYLWGGDTPAGFDCSGLVMFVMRQHGVILPHYSGSQFLLGEKVAPGDLQPGDVVFFGSPIHHVGMYIGGGYFVEAPRTGDFVKISVLATRSDYAGARRYDWQPRLGPIQTAVTTPAAALSTVN